MTVVAGDFDPPVSAIRDAVARALAEDLGVLGDLTSTALIPADATGTGHFVARVAGVLAGTAVATEVFAQLDPAVTVTWAAGDGDRLAAGQRLGTVSGPLRSRAHRGALRPQLPRPSVRDRHPHPGPRRRRASAAGSRARIRDTRKTTPGLRALEKAAVRAGGGANHRGNLSDAVLVKDNHLRHCIHRGARGSSGPGPAGRA